MSTSRLQKADRLLHTGAPVRARDLVAAGMHRVELTRRVRAGKLERIGRGLYALPGHQHITEHLGMLEVARRAPKVVFCLLSALQFHGLTTQSPSEVWIAIANKDHPPRMSWPPLRTIRFSPAGLREGIEVRYVAGTPIRVTSVARTVADCFKFRNKVGLDVALEALREVRKGNHASMDALWVAAKVDRATNVMRPYLEAVT